MSSTTPAATPVPFLGVYRASFASNAGDTNKTLKIGRLFVGMHHRCEWHWSAILNAVAGSMCLVGRFCLDTTLKPTTRGQVVRSRWKTLALHLGPLHASVHFSPDCVQRHIDSYNRAAA